MVASVIAKKQVLLKKQAQLKFVILRYSSCSVPSLDHEDLIKCTYHCHFKIAGGNIWTHFFQLRVATGGLGNSVLASC